GPVRRQGTALLPCGPTLHQRQLWRQWQVQPVRWLTLACAAVLLPSIARAEPILAADPALDNLAKTYERQQDTFARAESGQNLVAFIKPPDLQLVRDFFAQSKDFA